MAKELYSRAFKGMGRECKRAVSPRLEMTHSWYASMEDNLEETVSQQLGPSGGTTCRELFVIFILILGVKSNFQI